MTRKSNIAFENWKEPSEDVVKNFTNVFDICFHIDEEELKELFEDHNKLMEDTISLRVRRLNALYHTHLWKKHITEIVRFLHKTGIDFEKRILSGDLAVIKELADRKDRNCFVFATKYCSFVNPDEYPIFDSLVGKVLKHFHERKPLVEGALDCEKIRLNYEYEKYKELINEFRTQYGLEDCPYKEIDKFLWLVGKNVRNIDLSRLST